MSLNIQSQRFLQSIFGSSWPEAWVEWWKFDRETGKVDPSTHRWARAKDATPTEAHSVYFCVGLIAPGKRRALENVVSVHALVLDDVGTKVDKDMADIFEPLSPSDVLQTSIGNWQYMWAPGDEGFTVEEFRRLRRGLVEVYGPCDAGSPVQLVRLPMGVNGKWEPSHKRNFHIRIDSYVYRTKAEILAAFPAPPDGGGGGGGGKDGRGPQPGTIEEVRRLLDVLDNSVEGAFSYDDWINVGQAVMGAVGDEGFELWEAWSRRSPVCGVQFDPADKWETFRNVHSAGLGFLEIMAKERGAWGAVGVAAFDDGEDILGLGSEGSGALTENDFWAYVPDGTFICLRSDIPWTSVTALNNTLQGRPGKNAKGKDIMVPASDVLQRTKPVHQKSWLPGRPQIVRDTIVPSNGGVMRAMKGHTIYNKYVPPEVRQGFAERAGFWVDQVKRLYPAEWQHILVWMAHRVQRPYEKLNHALVLGGTQGIGKDYILRPMIEGVGEHNVQSIDPPDLLGSFNGYRQGVVLIINEIHNLGDGLNPFRFYENTKTLIAAPPAVLRVNNKYREEYYIPNLLGVVMTTNHKLDGLHVDENDRRHFIAWSDVDAENVPAGGWELAWQRMDDHVWDCVAYLRGMDLSKFDPKAPPDKTKTWHKIVGAGNVDSQDEMIGETLELMGFPDAFVRKDFMAHAPDHLQSWMEKASKPFANKLDVQGWEKARNKGDKSGRYKINGHYTTIYVRNDTDPKSQKEMVEKLIKSKEKGV